MKDQLLEKILSYLTNLEVFAKDQLPDFVNQYLSWCFYEHLFFIGLALLAVVISIIIHILANYAIKKYIYRAEDLNITKILACIFTGAMVLTFLIALSVNTYGIIKLKVAPKVYIVDKIVRVK